MRIITADCNLQELPVNSYDAVIIPNQISQQFNLARYALVNNKHVMLEAPAKGIKLSELQELERIALANKAVFYIAYGNRFIPELVQLKEQITNGKFGKIQHCRLLYESLARDNHQGALAELGPHIFNVLQYLFGANIMQHNFNIVYKGKFNRQVIFADFNANLSIEVEVNLLSDKEQISYAIYGTASSANSQWLFDDKTRHALMQLEQDNFPAVCQTWLDAKEEQWVYAELEHLQETDVLLA